MVAIRANLLPRNLLQAIPLIMDKPKLPQAPDSKVAKPIVLNCDHPHYQRYGNGYGRFARCTTCRIVFKWDQSREAWCLHSQPPSSASSRLPRPLVDNIVPDQSAPFSQEFSTPWQLLDHETDKAQGILEDGENSSLDPEGKIYQWDEESSTLHRPLPQTTAFNPSTTTATGTADQGPVQALEAMDPHHRLPLHALLPLQRELELATERRTLGSTSRASRRRSARAAFCGRPHRGADQQRPTLPTPSGPDSGKTTGYNEFEIRPVCPLQSHTQERMVHSIWMDSRSSSPSVSSGTCRA